MRRYNYNWYLIFAAVALVTVFFLYQQYTITKNLIGLVETKTHVLGAQEGGTIANLSLQVGDPVKQGQVLVTLDIADLEAEMVEFRYELSQIMDLADARQNRYSLEFKQTRLQIENEVSSLTERLAVLASKRTEFTGLTTEIERLQKAEQAGLGHTRDLSDLIVQRDAIAAYLREQSVELESHSRKLNNTHQMQQAINKVDEKDMVQSLLLDPLERLTELKRLIAITEHRMNMRSIISPADGDIVMISAFTGDVVQEYIPIITVEESSPVFITVYLPETVGLEPQPGQPVRIISSRSRQYNTTGQVTFIHPGLSMIPERLSFRGQLFWARKIQVKIDNDHQLLPGEIVHVRLLKKKAVKSALIQNVLTIEQAEAAEITQDFSNKLREIQVLSDLRRKTRFEPSAVTWCDDINRYLILSDDTGLNDASNEHAPWLFLMTESGAVDKEPIRLYGAKKINDLEAVAAIDQNMYYFVSSQNISKKGKRPVSRQMIYKVQRRGPNFSVIGQSPFLQLIVTACSSEKLAALGLGHMDIDGNPRLNIEGCVFFNGALYFGLKEPSSRRGAIIWKLDNPDSIFEGDLSENQLNVAVDLDLGSLGRYYRGISDMVLDSNLNLWVLSTVPGIDNQEQLSCLYKITGFPDRRIDVVRKMSFSRIKAEGLCFNKSGSMMIVFDNDQSTPQFVTVAEEEL